MLVKLMLLLFCFNLIILSKHILNFHFLKEKEKIAEMARGECKGKVDILGVYFRMGMEFICIYVVELYCKRIGRVIKRRIQD